MYLPDLFLLVGLSLSLLIGWGRGPGWLAAGVGLAAVGAAGVVLAGQPAGARTFEVR